MDLFDQQLNKNISASAPLADRMRPLSLAEYAGQEQIVGPGTLLRRAIENDDPHSMLFWGPPGSGKTTLAFVIAKMTGSCFEQLSAVAAGKKDLKVIIDQAFERRKFANQRTILFIDEIHRWNKAQQDALLPQVEKGVITLIGATTENPSFEVIAPLLSRCRVYVLKPLSQANLNQLLERALADREKGLGKLSIKLAADVKQVLFRAANGDARIILNALEIAAKNIVSGKIIDKKLIEDALQYKALQYDKAGDEHYNVISAFIKSMRGSNVDGALYWLARMLAAGEDPKFIARRMVVLASEDIGNADTNALQIANAVFGAVEKIGLPECRINLAQGVVYLCQAPKSNQSYLGLENALKEVKDSGNLAVPLHLRNAPTGLMRELDYGKDYKYTHSQDDSQQTYLPEEIKGRKFYQV